MIRSRWQITIPRRIRRALNLFEGQLLNFDLVEDLEAGQSFIRVYTGAAPVADLVAFREAMATRERKGKRGHKCARKSGKSDVQKTLRDLEKKSKRAREHSENTELEQVLSDLCDYSRLLQARLRAVRGD
jgi:bifunctional DNA-binding transcriptional regulator/antitoxin component of YhaV-PrlF toxin-antitoxin module